MVNEQNNGRLNSIEIGWLIMTIWLALLLFGLWYVPLLTRAGLYLGGWVLTVLWIRWRRRR